MLSQTESLSRLLFSEISCIVFYFSFMIVDCFVCFRLNSTMKNRWESNINTKLLRSIRRSLLSSAKNFCWECSVFVRFSSTYIIFQLDIVELLTDIQSHIIQMEFGASKVSSWWFYVDKIITARIHFTEVKWWGWTIRRHQ